MASLLKAGHPEYRRSLGERSLVLRWSTAADKAVCSSFVSCRWFARRKGERIRCEVFPAIHGRHVLRWQLVRPFLIYSLCHLLTKPEQTEHCASIPPQILHPPRAMTPVPVIDSYVDNMRAQAGGANERVVALVYFLSAEFAFHRNAVCLPVGKAQIVACKSAYRRGATTEGTIAALFEMVHARAYATGCAFLITSGIPTDYRTHGYGYALKQGLGLVTHTADLPASSREATPYTLRRATSADLPALERLVCAPRAAADIFAGLAAPVLKQQLRWLLGERPSPYATAEAYPVHPFFVLETHGRVVAAAGLKNTPSTQTAVVHVHPLLWDDDEDASAISLTLARELIKAVDDMLAPAKCV
ncbi:hypothetical protein B0H10DRAFT_866907 [Mycena sp. CBHHK59/15]|nr:hypothetical protein B0H10DRAFT_916345 [Mycena sp. CBHHK59/15]KAJ6623017.1 hypothetical protein B0H10DRAFT_866907 [Mycena sp. CBHHK59/15]